MMYIQKKAALQNALENADEKAIKSIMIESRAHALYIKQPHFRWAIIDAISNEKGDNNLDKNKDYVSLMKDESWKEVVEWEEVNSLYCSKS